MTFYKNAEISERMKRVRYKNSLIGVANETYYYTSVIK